jgi:hypothetical protein
LDGLRELNRQFVVPMSSFIELDTVQEKLFPWIDEILALHEEFAGLQPVVEKLILLAGKMEPVYSAHIVRLRQALEALLALYGSDARAKKVIDAAEIGQSKGLKTSEERV